MEPIVRAVLAGGALLLPQLIGCCCYCNRTLPITPPNVVDVGEGEATNGGGNGGGAADPNNEELKTAKEYARKALEVANAGVVKTADLRKDGNNWYVSGTAETIDGPAEYTVWFEVKRVGDTRQTWAVRTVKVNDEVVYAK